MYRDGSMVSISNARLMSFFFSYRHLLNFLHAHVLIKKRMLFFYISIYSVLRPKHSGIQYHLKQL